MEIDQTLSLNAFLSPPKLCSRRGLNAPNIQYCSERELGLMVLMDFIQIQMFLGLFLTKNVGEIQIQTLILQYLLQQRDPAAGWDSQGAMKSSLNHHLMEKIAFLI